MRCLGCVVGGGSTITRKVSSKNAAITQIMKEKIMTLSKDTRLPC